MVIGIIAIGWILIVIGVLMLLVEAFNPGFFIAVPGTTLIIIGIISLLFPELFDTPLIIIIGVIVALLSAGISVMIYSRIATDSRSPFTASKDSLIGKTGIVTKEISADSISGKVTIENVDWSATTEGKSISAGKKVKVTHSEGVHVTVEET